MGDRECQSADNSYIRRNLRELQLIEFFVAARLAVTTFRAAIVSEKIAQQISRSAAGRCLATCGGNEKFPLRGEKTVGLLSFPLRGTARCPIGGPLQSGPTLINRREKLAKVINPSF